MEVRAFNPELRPPVYETAMLPDGRTVQWPSFYFGARNGIPPAGIRDANAYYGTSMANTQRFAVDMRRPLTASLDATWAGAYPKTMWDPLYYFRGYPAAPVRSPVSEGIFVRTVPTHNELGYQMVLLRDNGVPIGGTPETTPNYVFAGPLQIGYMSAVRPIARREQMPGAIPPRSVNPAVPSFAAMVAGANAAGYGVDGGGPYSSWPATGPGWYPVRNAVMGWWPTYMYAPVGPPQLPISKPPPAQCANTNPETTMQNPVANVGHPNNAPAWVDPLAYRMMQRAYRKRCLPNPLPFWGAALLAATGVAAGAAGGYCMPRYVRYLSRYDEYGNREEVYIRFLPCAEKQYEARVVTTPTDPSIGPSTLGPERFELFDEAFAWAVGPGYEAVTPPGQETGGSQMEGAENGGGQAPSDQLPGTQEPPPAAKLGFLQNPWGGLHGMGLRPMLGLPVLRRRARRLYARECIAPGWCGRMGLLGNPFPGTGANYQGPPNMDPRYNVDYARGGYLLNPDRLPPPIPPPPRPLPPGTPPPTVPRRASRPLGTMRVWSGMASRAGLADMQNPEGAVCNPCQQASLNPACVVVSNPAQNP